MPTALEGIVYVDMEGGASIRPPVEGHWERDESGVAEAGEWSTVEEAIAWGRLRAPTVVVRRDEWVHAHRYYNSGELLIRLRSPVKLSHQFYSAGDHHHAGEDSERWPGGSDERDSDTVPGYGGAVHLIAGGEMWTGSGGFSLRWEAVRDGEMVLIEQAGAQLAP